MVVAARTSPDVGRDSDAQRSVSGSETPPIGRREGTGRVSFGVEAAQELLLTQNAQSAAAASPDTSSPSRRASGYRRASFINGERITENQLGQAAITAAQHAAAAAAAEEETTLDEEADEELGLDDETVGGSAGRAERSPKHRKNQRLSSGPNVVSTVDILEQRLNQSILEDGAIMAQVPLPWTMPGVKYSPEGLPIPLPAMGGQNLYRRTSMMPPPELIQVRVCRGAERRQ